MPSRLKQRLGFRLVEDALVDAVAGELRGGRAARDGGLELLGAQPLLRRVVALDPARALQAGDPAGAHQGAR